MVGEGGSARRSRAARSRARCRNGGGEPQQAGQEGRDVRRRALYRHRLHRSELDYLSSGWEIQYAVGCKLFNYPDKPGDAGSQLTPEAAAGSPIVSKDGKTYTFKIRPASSSRPART